MKGKKMFNVQKKAIIFIVIILFFLGCGGENEYVEECYPCDPNDIALELYRGLDLSVARNESEIIVTSCYNRRAIIKMAWDGQNQQCSLEEGNYFIESLIVPAECITCEFENHTSIQVCLFSDSIIFKDSDGQFQIIPPKLIESCDVSLANGS